MRKARGYWLLVMVGLALICGCTPVQLTSEEVVEQDLIVEKFNRSVGRLESAVKAVDAMRAVATELVATHADIVDKISLVIKAVAERDLTPDALAAAKALTAKLRVMKDDVESAKGELTDMYKGAVGDAKAAAAELSEARTEVKDFEKRVAKRVEDETGKRPSGFIVFLGTVLALATGGGGLKALAAIRALMAQVRKLKAGFKVTAGTLADLNKDATDGKATDEAKAAIRARLALTTELDEKELETLRRMALEG